MMNTPYSAKLTSRSSGFLVPLGCLLILLGTASVILSAIDLSNGRFLAYLSSTSVNSPVTTHVLVPSIWSEQSIWPSTGKGIWCGLFLIGVGILAIIAHREKTLVAVRILAIFAFVALIISLFLFLSSITVFQRYILDGRVNAQQRTSIEQTELVLNALLFICGVLSFLVSFPLVIGSLIVGEFCQRKRDQNMKSFHTQIASPPPYATPGSYYG